MTLINTDGEYISHDLLTDELIETRDYQVDLVSQSRNQNTMVALPTGLGKTTVSLLLTAERLRSYSGKSLLLAPTKPLVEQHVSFYSEALDIPEENIRVFTGDVRPAKRGDLWNDLTVVVATPQVIENDLVAERISLEDVSHITFDECHRATGDYAYNFIAEKYIEQANNPLVTAMSASPANDKDGVLDVCNNLFIENIEIKTEDDPSVSDYSYDTAVEWKRVSLPEEILEVRDLLQEIIKDRMQKLKDIGVTNSATKDPSQRKLNQMNGKIQELIDNGKSEGYEAGSMRAEVNKLTNLVEVVESQGVSQFISSAERNIINQAGSSSGSKADKRLMQNSKFTDAIEIAKGYDAEHPKLIEARANIIRTVANNDDARVLVFTESRETVELLVDFLSEYLDVQRFVGQADSNGNSGMTQKEQKETLQRFREGYFDVLVSTSVAEEGLDVPSVDLVLFYEPVPESVRTIQRKGRTGRQTEGQVVILVGVDDRDGGGSSNDEKYYWISQQQQKNMKQAMENLKESKKSIQQHLDEKQEDYSEPVPEEPNTTDADEDGTEQMTIQETVQQEQDDEEGTAEEIETVDNIGSDSEKVEIVIDSAELDSTVPRTLSKDEEVENEVQTLEVGDYVLSERVAVERKTVEDFLGSIVDRERNVFQQVKELSTAYTRPVIIIEGDGLYSSRNIHPNAIRGAIASLVTDFSASVLRTSDADETAALMKVIAEREQEESDKEVSLHGKKETRSKSEQQEYVVSSIADIGPVTAQSLLEEFDTVRSIMNAEKEELQKVEGIGDVTAETIQEIVTTSYDDVSE